MNLDDITHHDAQGMHEIYEKWPEIAAKSYNAHKRIDLAGINHIVFAGMGGSGTIGDAFTAILSRTSIHVSNIKGYLLPETVDSSTLVVATSVSGNTDETLTALETAAGLDCRVLAISSGGKMEQFCSKNNVDYRKIEKIHSPRASFVGYLYSLIRILESILPIGRQEVEESIKSMQEIQKEISACNLDRDNPSLNLAKWISGIPVIYYPFGLQSAAIRFKNCLQENAKWHAMTEDVIEACHNGIVSWEKGSDCQPILIRGKDDYLKTKERWGILEKYFEEKGIDFYAIDSVDGGILSKIVNLMYVFDYASIYLAIISGIDPTPVRSIDYIKSEM